MTMLRISRILVTERMIQISTSPTEHINNRTSSCEQLTNSNCLAANGYKYLAIEVFIQSVQVLAIFAVYCLCFANDDKKQ